MAALLAVLGPGLLAGLSDDDPAGITTYSILGADHGYELLWVLTLSTFALIVFHELGVRLGVVTGKGLLALVRDRFGHRVAVVVLAALLVANLGTLAAEFAGIAIGADLPAGIPAGLSVPAAAVGVTFLVFDGSFHRVEHVLLALASVFVTYVLAGILSHPDWGAAAQGAVVPTLPDSRDSVLITVATVGTTLAPWGLAFIQSYAVDKHLTVRDLRFERVDVIVGAVLTGVIGFFIVIACATTLHGHGIHVDDGADAARALEPVAGSVASTLFGLGFVGAALLAAAVVPLSSAYSAAEAFGKPADIDDSFAQARLFHLTYGIVVALAAGFVLIPGLSLVPVLYLTQALNAVLLLVLLPCLRHLGADPDVMGEHALGPTGRALTGVTLALVAASVVALLALTIA